MSALYALMITNLTQSVVDHGQPSMTVLTQTPWTQPTDRELAEALTAACGAVGTLPLTSAAWDELIPLVHECADALTPTVTSAPWPPSAIQACRRLAVVTRHLGRRPTPTEVDRELVLALADLIVLRASATNPDGARLRARPRSRRLLNGEHLIQTAAHFWL